MEAAEKCFREILEEEKGDVAATLGLGNTFEMVGDIEQALEVYQNGPAWEAGDPHLMRQAGYCAIRTRCYHHAELYFTAAKERNCISARMLAQLAYSQECQGRYKEAETTFLELIEHFPNHPAGYRGLAWLCGIGRSTILTPSDGIAIARHAIDLLPDHASWELLSACEARAGNFDEAHQIQEQLEAHELDSTDRQRRRNAMRTLRKKQPLEAHLMRRSLVA
jgi:tetratricopeptide (TPR) repeat protein